MPRPRPQTAPLLSIIRVVLSRTATDTAVTESGRVRGIAIFLREYKNVLTPNCP